MLVYLVQSRALIIFNKKWRRNTRNVKECFRTHSFASFSTVSGIIVFAYEETWDIARLLPSKMNRVPSIDLEPETIQMERIPIKNHETNKNSDSTQFNRWFSKEEKYGKYESKTKGGVLRHSGSIPGGILTQSPWWDLLRIKILSYRSTHLPADR